MIEDYEEMLKKLLMNLSNNALLSVPADGSPSLPDHDHSEPPPSPTPEPPDNEEYEAIRERAISIKGMLDSDVKGKGKESQSTLEQELLQMVLRLTAGPSSQTQLTEQAATVSRLLKQQEYLVHRMAEDRAVWESENQSMHRVAEALLRQVNGNRNYVHNDLRRHPVPSGSEVANLREKLSDYHSRIQTLESELQQLRPLLLMAPEALASAKGIILPPSHLRNLTKKDCDGDVVSPDNTHNDALPGPSQDKSSGPGPKRGSGGAKFANKTSKKQQSAAYFERAPKLADARTEHLLLAARRLGRERASLLGEAMYQLVDSSGAGVNAAFALNANGKGVQLAPGPGPYAVPLMMQAPVPVPATNSNASPVNTKGKEKASAASPPVERMPGMQAWTQGMWGAPLPLGMLPAMPHPQLAYGYPTLDQQGAAQKLTKGIRKKVSFSPPKRPGRKFILHPSSGQQPSAPTTIHVDPDGEILIDPELLDNDNSNNKDTTTPTHDEATRIQSVPPMPAQGVPNAGPSLQNVPNMHSHFQPAFVPHPGWPYYPYVFGQPYPFPSPSPLNLNAGPPNAVNTEMMPPPPTASARVPPPVRATTATEGQVASRPGSSIQSQPARRIVRPRPKNAQTRKKPTVSSSVSVPGSPQKETRCGTPTPMESLLSAAQSMLSPEPGAGAGSPPAKRRRRSLRAEPTNSSKDASSGPNENTVETAATETVSEERNARKEKPPVTGQSAKLGRQASGLDVLADQAIGPDANTSSRDESYVVPISEVEGQGGDESDEARPMTRTLRKRNRDTPIVVPIQPARRTTRAGSRMEAEEVASTTSASDPATTKRPESGETSVRVTRSRSGQKEATSAIHTTTTRNTTEDKLKERKGNKKGKGKAVRPQARMRQLRTLPTRRGTASTGTSRNEEEISVQGTEDAGETEIGVAEDADASEPAADDVEPTSHQTETPPRDHTPTPIQYDFSSFEDGIMDIQTDDQPLFLPEPHSQEVRVDDQPLSSSRLIETRTEAQSPSLPLPFPARPIPAQQQPQLQPQSSLRPASFSFRLRPVNFSMNEATDVDEDGDSDGSDGSSDSDDENGSIAIRLDGGGHGKKEVTAVGTNGDRIRPFDRARAAEFAGRDMSSIHGEDQSRRKSSPTITRSPTRKVLPSQNKHALDLPPIATITTVGSAEVDSDSVSSSDSDSELAEDEFGKR